MNRTMKFSWKALLLAPLPIPLVISVWCASHPGRHPIYGFLFFFVIGCVLSYGTTIFLFLPCLFLVSKLTPLTVRLTGLVGTVLGGLVWLHVSWQCYGDSGANCGPPQGTFVDYLRQNGFDWDFWLLLSAGLITALFYWYLANRWSGRNGQSTAGIPVERDADWS